MHRTSCMHQHLNLYGYAIHTCPAIAALAACFPLPPAAQGPYSLQPPSMKHPLAQPNEERPQLALLLMGQLGVKAPTEPASQPPCKGSFYPYSVAIRIPTFIETLWAVKFQLPQTICQTLHLSHGHCGLC